MYSPSDSLIPSVASSQQVDQEDWHPHLIFLAFYPTWDEVLVHLVDGEEEDELVQAELAGAKGQWVVRTPQQGSNAMDFDPND